MPVHPTSRLQSRTRRHRLASREPVQGRWWKPRRWSLAALPRQAPQTNFLQTKHGGRTPCGERPAPKQGGPAHPHQAVLLAELVWKRAARRRAARQLWVAERPRQHGTPLPASVSAADSLPRHRPRARPHAQPPDSAPTCPPPEICDNTHPRSACGSGCPAISTSRAPCKLRVQRPEVPGKDRQGVLHALAERTAPFSCSSQGGLSSSVVLLPALHLIDATPLK